MTILNLKSLVAVLMIALSSTAFAKTLTVYSSRSEHLIKPFFDEYTKKTGIKIRSLLDKNAVLISRLESESDKTPADILLTVDAGNLWHAARKGLLASIQSDVLEANVPNSLQDYQNRWFGLTIRARTIVYNKKNVNPSDLSTYEDLTKSRWRGKLCLRTSKKVYNQSLVAMLLAAKGEQKTLDIIKGWVANFAMPPLAKDSHVIKAIEKGRCDLGLVNTYYAGREMDKRYNLSKKVGVFFANQEGLGTHINISGAGVTKHSANKSEAIKLLEWLSSPKVQAKFASINHEYPINPKAEISEPLQSWGQFKQDDRPIYLMGVLQPAAVKLMDRAGYK